MSLYKNAMAAARMARKRAADATKNGQVLNPPS